MSRINKSTLSSTDAQTRIFCVIWTVICGTVASFGVAGLARLLLLRLFPDPIVRLPGEQSILGLGKLGPLLITGAPEPVESYTYYIFLLCLCCFSLAFSALFFYVLGPKLSDRLIRVGTTVGVFLIVVMAWFFVGYNALSTGATRHPYLVFTSLVLKPKRTFALLFVVAAFFVLWSIFRQQPLGVAGRAKMSHISGAAGLFFCVLVVVAATTMAVVDPNPEYASKYHFSVIFHPVYIISQGGSLGVDTRSLYGNYPYVLYFVQRVLFGRINLYNTMIVCTIFCVIGNLCQFGFLYKLTKSKPIALVGSLASIYILHYFPRLYFFGAFQGNPLRLFPPAVLLFLLSAASDKKSERTRVFKWLSFIFLGFGFLWNPEAGAVSILVFLAYHAYNTFHQFPITSGQFWKQMLKILVLAMLSVSLWLGLFEWMTFARSGQLLGLTDLFWSVLASQYGITLLPIPAHNPYYLVLIVYAVALIKAVSALRPFGKSEHHEENALLFACAITGLGMFVYFLGRSADINLSYCIWPAILILAYYLRLALRMVPVMAKNAGIAAAGHRIYKRGQQVAVCLFSILLLCIFTVSLYSYVILPDIPKWQETTMLRNAPAQDYYQNGVNLLRKNKAEDKSNAVICLFASDFASEAGVDNAYWGTSLIDAFFVKDYEDIVAFLKTYNGRVFLMPYLFFDETQLRDGSAVKDAVNTVIQERYEVVDRPDPAGGIPDENAILWCFDSI